MNMIRKGNFLGIDKGDVQASVGISTFGIAKKKQNNENACP